jgi:prolyl oligopeptidase
LTERNFLSRFSGHCRLASMGSLKGFMTQVFRSVVGRGYQAVDEADDLYRWLETVDSSEALSWVRERNDKAAALYGSGPQFESLFDDLAAIAESSDKTPLVSKRGAFLYNFHRDAQHPRGLWRRTTPEQYRQETPEWDVLIDFDALAAAEGENWVFSGVAALPHEYRRCLVSLSRGGADAVVIREFDIETRQFVPDGFCLPEAKSVMRWIDQDSVYVGTDYGPGSRTDSGYPRIIKLWRRGQALEDAVTVFEGQSSDVSVGAFHDHTPGFPRDVFSRSVTFYTWETWVSRGGTLVKVPVPEDASVSWYNEWMLISLRSEWAVNGATYRPGSLLITRVDEFLAGAGSLELLYEPSTRASLHSYVTTKHWIVLCELENVRHRVFALRREGGTWKSRAVGGLPNFGVIDVSAYDPYHSDELQFVVQDFITPPTLLFGSVDRDDRETLKAQRPYFDATGLVVTQHEVASADGTIIPYFQVARQDLPLDGSAKTILYGYGGFEISVTPSYAARVGKGWLERGGVWVVANIRGGGEFGPEWHKAALKEHRHRAYDDFSAVAQDLVRRGVTTPRRLGAMGGSNGGLLIGNMLVTYPGLWGALVSRVPLLDMRNYHTLLAGASWIAEYGDPRKPEEWFFLRRYSPYHQLKAGVEYPPVLFTTSTRDDRVHPAHARKMVARMEFMSLPDVLLYENIEGGHAGAAVPRQEAFMDALVYNFFHTHLGDDE